MKKIIFALILFVIVSIHINSQESDLELTKDIKINAASLAFLNFSLNYEQEIKENNSVGIWLSYFTYNLSSTDDQEKYGVSIIPEYRIYFNSFDQNNRFFAGSYFKYAMASETQDRNGYSENTLGNTIYENVEAKQSILALGVTFGKKWATDGGFIFETSFGIGRVLINGVNFSNDIVYHAHDDDYNIDELSGKVDLRFGINIGYRF